MVDSHDSYNITPNIVKFTNENPFDEFMVEYMIE